MPAGRSQKQRFRPVDRHAFDQGRPQYQIQRGGRMLDPDLMDDWDDPDSSVAAARALWRRDDDE